MSKLEIIKNALNWQAEAESRSVSIEVGRGCDLKEFSVWCFDYKWMHGEHVQDGRQIDIEASYKVRRKADFEKLKAEFAE